MKDSTLEHLGCLVQRAVVYERDGDVLGRALYQSVIQELQNRYGTDEDANVEELEEAYQQFKINPSGGNWHELLAMMTLHRASCVSNPPPWVSDKSPIPA